VITNPKAMADTRLRPHQREGVAFARHNPDGAVFYWYMGAGKTRAGLLVPQKFDLIVIVAPKVTQGVWAAEVEKVYPGQVMHVLRGRDVEDLPPDIHIAWLNYEIAQYKFSTFQDRPIDCLLLDEAQSIKNKRAQRTQAVHAICGLAKKVIALTGTPIYSRPRDLWAILWAVQGGEWPSYYDFVERYCDGRPTGYGGYDASGLSTRHAAELRGRLSRIVHRVKWEDTSDNIPKLDRVRVPVVLDETKYAAYRRCERDLRKVLEGYEGTASPASAAQLRRISKLRLLVGQAKAAPAVEFLSTIPPDEKVVVWMHHREVMQAIADKLEASGEHVAQIHGGMSSRQQSAQLALFRGPSRFILVSLEVGALGIDLTAARISVTVEPSWTPAVLAQAERRTHRSTQLRPCLAYYLLAQRTIEDRIFDVLEEKVKLTYEALDDGELLSFIGDITPRRDDILRSIVDMIRESAAGRDRG